MHEMGLGEVEAPKLKKRRSDDNSAGTFSSKKVTFKKLHFISFDRFLFSKGKNNQMNIQTLNNLNIIKVHNP